MKLAIWLIIQVPTFVGAETEALLAEDNLEARSQRADSISKMLKVYVASLPRDTNGLLLASVQEARSGVLATESLEQAALPEMRRGRRVLGEVRDGVEGILEEMKGLREEIGVRRNPSAHTRS
jgi:hypothetical protein